MWFSPVIYVFDSVLEIERITNMKLDDCSIKHSASIIILLVFVATGITIIILPSVHGSAVQTDRFGISEIYPLAVNGNEWYSM